MKINYKLIGKMRNEAEMTPERALNKLSQAIRMSIKNFDETKVEQYRLYI